MNVNVLLIFQHQCLPLIYIQDYGDQLLSKERTMIIIYRSYLKYVSDIFISHFQKLHLIKHYILLMIIGVFGKYISCGPYRY